jgi:hypothetical protein
MSWTETTNETLTKKSILESKSVEGRYQGHFFKRTKTWAWGLLHASLKAI